MNAAPVTVQYTTLSFLSVRQCGYAEPGLVTNTALYVLQWTTNMEGLRRNGPTFANGNLRPPPPFVYANFSGVTLVALAPGLWFNVAPMLPVKNSAAVRSLALKILRRIAAAARS
jgi:hypothetical protein